MDRIYVTGARGMLGRAVVSLFSGRYEVYPRDLRETDVRDFDTIIEEICGAKPRFVLHLAAMTDVDNCETDPDEAYRTNALGTRHVSLACRRCGAVMVYVSTGSIYAGDKPTPYTEYDAPAPVNVYGRSKHRGELEVRSLLDRFFIFNTCWVFGGGPEDKKFVAKIVRKARAGEELRVVDDLFGSPTYTVDLARAIFDFIESGLFGTYHLVNPGVASRLDETRVILDAARIRNSRLVPCRAADFAMPAPRPRMEALDNYNFRLLGVPEPRPWQEALEEYVRETFAG